MNHGGCGGRGRVDRRAGRMGHDTTRRAVGVRSMPLVLSAAVLAIALPPDHAAMILRAFRRFGRIVARILNAPPLPAEHHLPGQTIQLAGSCRVARSCVSATRNADFARRHREHGGWKPMSSPCPQCLCARDSWSFHPMAVGRADMCITTAMSAAGSDRINRRRQARWVRQSRWAAWVERATGRSS